jgi:hypothetical protein
MTMWTKVKTNTRAALTIRAVVALLLAGCLPVAHAQVAAGRLSISVNVQASYYVEAKGEGYSSIGQGIADGSSLRAPVRPGEVTVRVLKANSRSATYSLVVSGGKEDLRMRSLLYDTAVAVAIPDSQSDLPLVLSVIPD